MLETRPWPTPPTWRLSWVRTLLNYYSAAELVGFRDFPRAAAGLKRFLERPAVIRGVETPKRLP